MTTALYPASMKLKAEEGNNLQIQTSQKLPAEYEVYHIPSASVECMDYPFGCIITQEIQEKDWTIGWYNLFIKQQTPLLLFIEQPMVTLYFSLKGTLCTHLEKRENLAFGPNEFGFYYIPPKTLEPIELSAGTYESVYFSFSKRYFNKFTDQNPVFQKLLDHLQLQPNKGQVLPTFQIGYDEKELLGLIRSCQLKGPAREMYLGARLIDLLINYFVSLEIADKEIRPVTDYESKIRDTAIFIQKNYPHPLSIPDLCKLAGMNITSFERSFKRIYGVLPRVYIEQLRVRKGASLLKKTILSVKDISYNVGFQAPHYFAAVFKKYFNCSPREYRENGRAAFIKGKKEFDEKL